VVRSNFRKGHLAGQLLLCIVTSLLRLRSRIQRRSHLIRALLRRIPFWRRHLEGIANLEEQIRLLTEAATDRARKLQEREAEFAEIATETARKFQEREAELAEIATETARKFQEREAEFAEIAAESARKLQQREAEFAEIAAESARLLQEREAKLTEALAVMSLRVARLSEHNRWLAETVMDAAIEFQEWDEDFNYLKEREQKTQYLPQQKRVLMVTSALGRAGANDRFWLLRLAFSAKVIRLRSSASQL
jgi:chromosome segregation ATPase